MRNTMEGIAMQAKELTSISVSPLVTAPFASQWSQDDQISLITERGVHVFELIPSPTCPHPIFKFSRSFIYTSEILPGDKFASEVDSVLWKLGREELYSLLMEEALTPRVDGATDTTPRIIGVAWSPRRLMHPFKCLLAIMTSAGAIEILFKVSKDWLSFCDLSTIWFDMISDRSSFKIVTDTNETDRYLALRKYVRRVQGTAIVWSDLYEETEACFAYLVTAYRSSDIVVWYVPAISYSSQDLVPFIVFETNMGADARINVLNWINLGEGKCLIVVGYFDGRVDGLLIERIEGKFRKLSINRYWTYPDRISVSCIALWKRDQSGVEIIATKGSFLILFDVTLEGSLKEERHMQMAGFSISGFVAVNDRQVIITTQNGGLFAITLVNGQLVSKPITHDLQQSRVQYLGISSSLNRALFLNITSPNCMHDHLINREPSTLCIFNLEGEEWDPLSMLKRNEKKSLTRHWDCLELIRVNAAKAQDSQKILPPVPQKLEALSTYELRIVMWISVIAEAYGKKKVSRRIENIVGEISEAQPLIFARLASDRLISLASKKTLSKEQLLCVSLLRSYIEVYLAGEEDIEETPIVQQAEEALSLTSHISPLAPESCELCGEIITEVSWKVTSCPSGHKLPRCAATLLQISTVNYRTCPICGQILHPCLDEEFREPLCPFCEVAALHDCRVLNIKDKAGSPIRNLSRRPISASSQPLKPQGAEKTEHIKEPSRTTRTLAVFVDKTEDERYSITETWEEF